jgi:hypothetical protein
MFRMFFNTKRKNKSSDDYPHIWEDHNSLLQKYHDIVNSNKEQAHIADIISRLDNIEKLLIEMKEKKE